MLRVIGKEKWKIIMSTGIFNIDEIEDAISVIEEEEHDLILF